MTSIQYSGNPKIKAAQQRNERELLKHIRRAVKERGVWQPLLLSHAWHNALDRLKTRGKVVITTFGYTLPKR